MEVIRLHLDADLWGVPENVARQIRNEWGATITIKAMFPSGIYYIDKGKKELGQ